MKKGLLGSTARCYQATAVEEESGKDAAVANLEAAKYLTKKALTVSPCRPRCDCNLLQDQAETQLAKICDRLNQMRQSHNKSYPASANLDIISQNSAASPTPWEALAGICVSPSFPTRDLFADEQQVDLMQISDKIETRKNALQVLCQDGHVPSATKADPDPGLGRRSGIPLYPERAISGRYLVQSTRTDKKWGEIPIIMDTKSGPK